MKKYLCIAFLIAFILNANGGLFGTHDINNIQKESPLYSFSSDIGFSDDDKKIRESILKSLPIGSDSNAIQSFLKNNFINIPYTVRSRTSKDDLYTTKSPHVFIQAIDISTFAGGERLQIYLLLDSDTKLKDVVVRSYKAYL